MELKIGALEYFPEKMRGFDRNRHDGLVLDDVRDLQFLSDHQDKLQGEYDSRVEFASTPGGTCAYTKYLYAVPTVVTFNNSTANLHFLMVFKPGSNLTFVAKLWGNHENLASLVSGWTF